MLQGVAVYCSMLQGVAVRCSALQCVAVCCSVLQRAVGGLNTAHLVLFLGTYFFLYKKILV